MSRTARAGRALVLLTLSTMRRLLREGMVLRSMVWPSMVVMITLTATIAALAAYRPARRVAVPEARPELTQWLEEAGFQVHPVADPRSAVAAQQHPVGTDGRTLWARGTSTTALDVEHVLRVHQGASWVPHAPEDLPDLKAGRRQGRMISRILVLLFVMYGTVFGLGGVARDRDDGSLEAELSLPIPRWIGGLARWLASTLILSVFFSLSVVMLAAVIGVARAPAMLLHGVAACGAGVAIGLIVVGTAGIKQGFSGPIAAALTAIIAVAGVGAYLQLGWLPIASVFVGGSGAVPVGVSVLMGFFASAVYAVRTGRA